MKNLQQIKRHKQLRRSHRVRSRVQGSETRPRLSVKRSLKHIYAQVINDEQQTTLAASSDKVAGVGEAPKDMSAKQAVAFAVGKDLAQKAKKKGITTVVFDRGSYRYHGRVKALADGARAGGLEF